MAKNGNSKCTMNITIKQLNVVETLVIIFFFQAEDGIRDRSVSRGLGDVYKRQDYRGI